ncbi:MAG: hypothetical protein AB2L14_23160 [Candidatus Xenobiia bacterium LiM19]
MPVYVFLDLDDTIFQTERKCHDSDILYPAACSKDGCPLSFMTQKQHLFFSHILCNAVVIPATARNLDAFRRVSLPFSHEAIIDFGGVILTEDGTPDKKWDGTIRTQALSVKKDLHELHSAIGEFSLKEDLKVRSRIISDFDMDLYIVSKHDGSHPDSLDRLHRYYMQNLKHPGMYIHYNDNNLSIIPRFINKASAVSHLIEGYSARTCETIVTVGMADSVSDVPFMSLCDYCIIPKNSQIMNEMMEESIVQRQL